MLTCTQGSLSVSAYFSKFKGLWDSLISLESSLDCDCGGAYLRKEQVMTFLMGLFDVFNNVRGNILLQELIPDINKVYSMVLQDEKQRRVSSTTSVETSSIAFVISKNNKGPKRDQPQCSHCGLLGHTKEKLFKLHGYPLVLRR